MYSTVHHILVYKVKVMLWFLNFFPLQVPQGSLGMYLLYGVLIIKLKSAIPEPI